MDEHRKILHLDLDAFYCAVEEQRDPSLRNKPFAVGGRPGGRGVVASCSYPARQYGVHSAMPMSQAQRLCPDLLIVTWSKSNYGEVSRRVMDILHDFTPLVEQLSIDEAFLDVSALEGTPQELAQALQKTIREQLDLPCSIGAGSNKLIAKIANNIGKSRVKTGNYPRAITVIPPGEESAFLAPLDARELWGVGPKTAERLAEHGLHTIGNIANFPPEKLEAMFGKHGKDIARHARGIDTRPVVTYREIKSISRETTYPYDTNHIDTLKRTLWELSKEVGKRLRKKNLYGRTITLKLRWSDFTTLTPQRTLLNPVNDDETIYGEALHLLDAHRPPERHVRLIGVGVSSFEENPIVQLSLWD